jgi:DNA helicase-2/ATP-dependent DNA helicase PcrA
MRMLHGQTRYNIESRFIDEIPDKLLKRLNVAKQQAAYAAPQVQVKVNSTQSVGGFKIGQQVSHAKFGLGVIVQAEGRGNDARLQVNFRDAGIKWLALEYAKLTNA